MRNLKIGLLGCGAMGSAIFHGLQKNLPKLAISQGITLELCAWNRTPATLASLLEKGVHPAHSPEELVARVDYILIGAATSALEPLLRQVKEQITASKLVIAMAPGTRLSYLKHCVEDRCPVVRLMPNTPAHVGKGLFALCLDDPSLNQEQKDLLEHIFAALGSTTLLPEEHFPAFTALAGSGPAYVFYFMEALAEAGVSMGLSRKDSTELSFGLIDGCLTLVQESGKHVSLLREEVSAPGGTTIAAVNHLDRTATRANIVDALLAAQAKAIELGKE